MSYIKNVVFGAVAKVAFLIASIILVILAGEGCGVYVLQNSPEPLPKYKTSVGIGVTGVLSAENLSDGGALPVISIRHGISKNSDIGFRVIFFPIPEYDVSYMDFAFDLKYRVFRYSKFNLTLFPQIQFSSLESATGAFIPGVIFGFRKSFGAVRFVLSNNGYFPEYYVGSNLEFKKIGFIVDVGIAGKGKYNDYYIVIPEFNIYYKF